MTRPDFVIPLHGAQKDKTAAARAKTYRQRKRQRVEVAAAAAAKVGRPSSAVGAIAEPSEVQPADTPPAVTVDRDEAVTPHHEEPSAPPRIVGDRFHVEHRDATGQSFNQSAVMAVAPVLLTIAALALRAVGIAINGWFAPAAMTRVGQAADPQTDAAIKLVAWISRGIIRPAPDDFAMVRVILLALLPQIGGMLLLIRRRSAGGVAGAGFNACQARLGSPTRRKHLKNGRLPTSIVGCQTQT